MNECEMIFTKATLTLDSKKTLQIDRPLFNYTTASNAQVSCNGIATRVTSADFFLVKMMGTLFC